MRPTTISLLAFGVLTGCATAPEKIKATNVAVTQYSGKNCAELATEYSWVDQQLTASVDVQGQARSADVAGVILIGLPVGSMTTTGSNREREEKIARLKGEKIAINKAQQVGGCLAPKPS